MRLRTQLILVSLFMMVLPWSGCQYLADMEQALRQGQTLALTATAHAVSARLENDEQLLLGLGQADKPETLALYAPSINRPFLIDGYAGEWPKGTLYRSSPAFASARFAQDGQYLYGFMNVKDAQFNYHNPSQGHIASGDHIRIQGANVNYLLRAEGPGDMVVFKQVENKTWRKVYYIKAALLENDQSYHIEFAMPLKELAQRLAISIIDQPKGVLQAKRYWIGVAPDTLKPMALKYSQASLNNALQVFTRNGLRISLADKHAWQVASAGDFTGDTAVQAQHGLVSWFYRLVLQNRHFSLMDTPEVSGRYSAQEVSSAVNGVQASQWYYQQNQLIARSAVPLQSDGVLLGAVIVEQSTDAVFALTNTAFNRLFIYTFLGAIFIAAVLLMYASWLSFRIRRLSVAAESALADDGHVHTGLPSVKSADELGDLARSYQQLLSRVQEYTQYLRTLSDKLSHELRTPLAIVKGSLDNLSDLSQSDELNVYIHRAQKGSERLSAMLLAMSTAKRIEESISSAQRQPVKMHSLLLELQQAYQQAYPAVNICLDVEPLSLDIADELIVQMLDKLIDNAASFCPDNGQIDISLHKTATTAVLSVSNNGPLLPAHMQHQLFDSLVSSRGKTPVSDNIHMGLGLYIVKLIASFHGATVSASNRSDATGVIFSITFMLP